MDRQKILLAQHKCRRFLNRKASACSASALRRSATSGDAAAGVHVTCNVNRALV